MMYIELLLNSSNRN